MPPKQRKQSQMKRRVPRQNSPLRNERSEHNQEVRARTPFRRNQSRERNEHKWPQIFIRGYGTDSGLRIMLANSKQFYIGECGPLESFGTDALVAFAARQNTPYHTSFMKTSKLADFLAMLICHPIYAMPDMWPLMRKCFDEDSDISYCTAIVQVCAINQIRFLVKRQHVRASVLPCPFGKDCIYHFYATLFAKCKDMASDVKNYGHYPREKATSPGQRTNRGTEAKIEEFHPSSCKCPFGAHTTDVSDLATDILERIAAVRLYKQVALELSQKHLPDKDQHTLYDATKIEDLLYSRIKSELKQDETPYDPEAFLRTAHGKQALQYVAGLFVAGLGNSAYAFNRVPWSPPEILSTKKLYESQYDTFEAQIKRMDAQSGRGGSVQLLEQSLTHLPYYGMYNFKQTLAIPLETCVVEKKANLTQMIVDGILTVTPPPAIEIIQEEQPVVPNSHPLAPRFLSPEFFAERAFNIDRFERILSSEGPDKAFIYSAKCLLNLYEAVSKETGRNYDADAAKREAVSFLMGFGAQTEPRVAAHFFMSGDVYKHIMDIYNYLRSVA